MLQSFCQQRIHLVELGTLPNQMVKTNIILDVNIFINFFTFMHFLTLKELEN